MLYFINWNHDSAEITVITRRNRSQFESQSTQSAMKWPIKIKRQTCNQDQAQENKWPLERSTNVTKATCSSVLVLTQALKVLRYKLLTTCAFVGQVQWFVLQSSETRLDKQIAFIGILISIWTADRLRRVTAVANIRALTSCLPFHQFTDLIGGAFHSHARIWGGTEKKEKH